MNKTEIVSLLRCGLCFALLLLLSVTSHAQNRVVVIPLQGDDVIIEIPAPLTPTAPIANVDTDQSDYTIGALTAVDNITKLEWQRMDDDVERNWGNAWDYCAALDLDSHDDWRLPLATELQSISDYGSTTAPFIDPVAFTNTNVGTFYWSATNAASNSLRAWAVVGGFIGEANKTNTGFVRCVR